MTTETVAFARASEGTTGTGYEPRTADTGARSPRGRIRDLLGRAWALNRPLTVLGVAMVGLLAVAAAGIALDPRVVTGAPAWLKPAKFATSVAIYSFTFVWLLTFVRGRPRLVKVLAWTTVVTLGIEMAIIVAAAALGTTSHFNVSTPLHAAVWGTMASSIVVTWMANLAVGVLLLIQRMADRAFAWSLRLGVAISSVGMGVAFFMTSPTAEQLTAARSGQGMAFVGAHSVGVADGGPGLPIVGWSTVGGDLRAAHFIGLHGLQVLPIVGILIARYAPAWLRAGHRVGLVWTVGLAYLGTVALVAWQALRAQPLIRPDALTLTTAAALAAATVIASAAIVAHARRTR
jgi:hypothetical protein